MLSEEFASRSKANPQSKHPYIHNEPTHKLPAPQTFVILRVLSG
jgi:hypothetical protein